MKEPVDEPLEIAKKAIEEQKRILSGYWGHASADKKKLKEASNPSNVAISLAGEPTTYPYIAELVEEFNKMGMTTFLVTNGQNPEKIPLIKPSQLYLSLIAYDPVLYKKVNVPQVKNGWARLNESIDAFRDCKGKTVIRITLIRGYNLEAPARFAGLIERAEPDFIEPKGYVHVGYSRRRLERSDMPSFEEVLHFSRRLCSETGYALRDSSQDSKVALLDKN